MPGPLLILGASVRAAAFSAIRAGFGPIAVDLFADEDLAAACPARRNEPSSYPGGLATAAAESPRGPWIYTGALENHPDLLDRIAAVRPPWGNVGDAVRRARDPVAIADILRNAGLPALDVRTSPIGLPRDGSWLVKPVRSAAGARIRPLDGTEPVPDEGGAAYYQRRATGPSGSAVFVGEAGVARLLGITRQWVGHGGVPFGYLGSVGPVHVAGTVRAQLERTGAALASAIGLRGLFGIDFVLADGVAWPTEINPRYTASVEVLEYASGRALLRDHAAAFGVDLRGEGHAACIGPNHRCVGKAIVYATTDGVVPPSIRWGGVDPHSGLMPRLADLPAPGSSFRAGQPVLTLLEAAPSADACRRRLARRLAAWRARLRGWSGIAGGEMPPR